MSSSTESKIAKTWAMEYFQKEVHRIAVEHGWWEIYEQPMLEYKPRNVPEMLALIHSEVSEAMEEYRKNEDWSSVKHAYGNKPEGFWIEMADVIIRVLDLAERYGVSMAEMVAIKNDYNETRPYRHGGKTA